MNIYIDCTDLAIDNTNCGIRRVERNILKSFLKNNKEKPTIIPVAYLGYIGGIKELTHKNDQFELNYFQKVYFLTLTPTRLKRLSKAAFPPISSWLEHNWKKYRYILLPLLLLLLPIVCFIATISILIEKKIEPKENEIYFIPGSTWWSNNVTPLFNNLKNNHTKIGILFHDLIPITYADHCNEKHKIEFSKSLKETIEFTDLAISISHFTLNELNKFIKNNHIISTRKLSVNYSGFSLDLCNGDILRDEIKDILNDSYITVGTIDPRKNHQFLLDSFENLWIENIQRPLCIIGKYGWKSEHLVKRILTHPEFGKRLFWFDDLNDDELLYAYEHAKACVYPSITEGFGLPLIEALSLKCPVLASDIPIFHEVGGDYCHYFSLDDPKHLFDLIEKVEQQGLLDDLSYLDSFSWPDWNESTTNLLKILSDV